MDIRNALFDIHIMSRPMQADIMAKSKHNKSEIHQIVFHCFFTDKYGFVIFALNFIIYTVLQTLNI